MPDAAHDPERPPPRFGHEVGFQVARQVVPRLAGAGAFTVQARAVAARHAQVGRIAGIEDVGGRQGMGVFHQQSKREVDPSLAIPPGQKKRVEPVGWLSKTKHYVNAML